MANESEKRFKVLNEVLEVAIVAGKQKRGEARDMESTLKDFTASFVDVEDPKEMYHFLLIVFAMVGLSQEGYQGLIERVVGVENEKRREAEGS